MRNVCRLLRVKTGAKKSLLSISSPLELSYPAHTSSVARVDFLAAKPKAPSSRSRRPPRRLGLEDILHRWMVAMTFVDKVNPIGAQNYFKEIIDRIPGSDKNVIKSQLWANIGLLHGWLGEHSKAKETFETALAFDMGSPLFHFLCGVAAYGLSDYRHARRCFENCTKWMHWWETDLAQRPTSCDQTSIQQEWDYRFGSFDWELRNEYVEYNVAQCERAAYYQENDVQPSEGCGIYCPAAFVLFIPPKAPLRCVPPPDTNDNQSTSNLDEGTNIDIGDDDQDVERSEEAITHDEDNGFDERDSFEGIDALLLRLRGEKLSNREKSPSPPPNRPTNTCMHDSSTAALSDNLSPLRESSIIEARASAVRISKLRGLRQSRANSVLSTNSTTVAPQPIAEPKHRPPGLNTLERKRIASFLSDRSTPPTVGSLKIHERLRALRSSSKYSDHSILGSYAGSDVSDENYTEIPELNDDKNSNSREQVFDRTTPCPSQTSSRGTMSGALRSNSDPFEQRSRQRPQQWHSPPQRPILLEKSSIETIRNAQTRNYAQVLPRTVYEGATIGDSDARLQSPRPAPIFQRGPGPLERSATLAEQEILRTTEIPEKMQARDEPRGNLPRKKAPSVNQPPIRPTRDLNTPVNNRKIVPSMMMFDPEAVKPTPTQSPVTSVINLAKADVKPIPPSIMAKAKAKEGALARLKQARHQFR